MRKAGLFVLLLILLIVGIALYSKQAIKGSKNFQPTNQVSTSEGQPASSETQTPLQEISLIVLRPGDKEVVNDSMISVSGKTVANADVSVNDKELKADEKGDFSTTLDLDEGDNTIVVVANDANGQASEKDITVTYTPTNSQ